MIFPILLGRFVVRGQSMEPTFREGQTLLVSSIPYLFRQPKISEVVVIKDPRDGRLLLKRIIRCHPEQGEGSRDSSASGLRMTFFVSGDNPESSTDSRRFGLITKEQILGKVIWDNSTL